MSEKSHLAAEKNQVVLKVRTDATKKEIRQAVELLFEVEVDDVTVINVKGKTKRFGQKRGRRNDWKKAYVRLAEGSQIETLLGTE
jgi:large subunit ribosomal protein L23